MKNPSPLAFAFVVALSPTLPANAEERPLDLSAFALGPGVELVADGESHRLRIEAAVPKEGPRLILEIDDPAVARESYALAGEIRYEGVEGEGFLETWNHFPAETGGRKIAASYFTRTMDESGPMAKIRGDSAWRPFSLPFFMTDKGDRRPLKITFNLHLASHGLVEIRNLRLLDGLPGGASRSNAWWSPRTSGILGAALGVLLGLWGSVARLLAARGIMPRLAQASFIAWTAMGTSALVSGIICAALGQPAHVVLIPILFGAVLAGVGSRETAALKKRETERELRRIRAADI